MSDLVPVDPRLPWVQPAWLREVGAWIQARLDARGIELVGEIEQPHVRWWSTVLRVPTTTGDLWFKANAPPHVFEASLLVLLERIRPDPVPELVAVDETRGWMLMRDGGTRLRELVTSAHDLHRLAEALATYAELQLAASPRVDDLLAAGVPDQRLALLPAQFAALLDDPEALLIGRTGGITAEEHEHLRPLVADLAATCRQLADHGIPETIQHDDFHDWNVFVHDGRYLVLDWGDSCVSHPFHSLVVAMRAIAHRLELPPGGRELLGLRDAYLEAFTRFGSPDDLRAAADLAQVSGSAARTLAWRRFLQAREPEFRDDVESVPYGLRLLLDRGPVGSWR